MLETLGSRFTAEAIFAMLAGCLLKQSHIKARAYTEDALERRSKSREKVVLISLVATFNTLFNVNKVAIYLTFNNVKLSQTQLQNS